MTRRLSLLAAVLAASALAPLEASAQQTSGWYVGGGLGANWLRDSDVGGGGVATSKAEFDTGWAGILSGGYGLGNGIRLELELGYRNNDVDKVAGTSGRGDVTQWSLMGNAIYDFATGTAFTPYVGIGLGGVRVDVDGGGTFAGGRTISDDDTVFAYQGLLGVAYAIAPQWKLDLGYRYFASADPSFKTNDNLKVDAEECFGLRWEERGGPLVVPPVHKGFGTTLLEASLPQSTVRLSYNPEGLVYELDIPRAAISDDSAIAREGEYDAIMRFDTDPIALRRAS